VWAWMVGVINAHSSLNFDKQKFVKVLNKLIVACIVLNTFQTSTSWFIDCLALGSNSFALNNSHALMPTIDVANTIDVAYHYNNMGLFCDSNIIANNKERSFQKPAVANHNSS
jgi:hypothetical protein